MAIIFNIDEGVKRSDFGVLETSIRASIVNKAEPFEKKSLLKNYFIVRSTGSFEERFRSEGRTLGEFKLSDDLEDYPLDDDGEGFAKSFGVNEWKNSFVISQQLVEDGDIAKIRSLSQQLITGFYRGREYFARALISGGLAGKYAYTRANGAVKNFDCTTLDTIDGGLDTVYKVPLFSVAHRLPENHFKVGGKSVVQANKFGVKATGGLDLTDDPLVVEKIIDLLGQIRAYGRQLVGENGKTAGVTYNKILVPTHYRLKRVLQEAIKGDSSWELIEDEYLDGRTGFAEADKAFLVVSSEALAETEGAVWLDRIPVTIKSYIVKSNDANVWQGRARYGAGFVSYRHIAYVSVQSLVAATLSSATLQGQAVSDIGTIVNRNGTVLKTNHLFGAAANKTDLNDLFYAFDVVAHGAPVHVTAVPQPIAIVDETPVVP